MKNAYIVICYIISGCDQPFCIDSVWTSSRKARKRCSELNSESEKEWREDHGYGFFEVIFKSVSK